MLLLLLLLLLPLLLLLLGSPLLFHCAQTSRWSLSKAAAAPDSPATMAESARARAEAAHGRSNQAAATSL